MIYVPPCGGTERSMQNYFKQLAEYYDIYVFCFLMGNKKFPKKNQFDLDGVHITQSIRPLELQVRDFVFEKRPSLIATCLMGSEIIIKESTRLGIPTIFFAHGIYEDVCAHQIRRDCPYDDVLTCPNNPICANKKDHPFKLEKYNKCKKIICNSEFTKSAFEKIYPETKYKI